MLLRANRSPMLFGSLFFLALLPIGSLSNAAQFKVGFAERDLTPKASVPMWGYGGLGSRMSTGMLDPLMAKAVVIDVGDHKLAIVGIDIGRGPRGTQMEFIRKNVKEKSGVDYVMISGSHTHHGPVTELTDVEGKGKGKFDDAVAYVDYEQNQLADAINEAAAKAVDAKLGWGSARIPMCRNRHTKFNPRPVDDEMTVFRFDDEAGKPIALIINFSAHPTILESIFRKFSAEWPGQMKKGVEQTMGTHCVFMQGSAGDLSPNTTEITSKAAKELKDKDQDLSKVLDELEMKNGKVVDAIFEMRAFGKQMADEVLKIAPGIQTKKPDAPSIQGKDEDFEFVSRIPFDDPSVRMKYSFAFFKELVGNFEDELKNGKIHPHLTTILLNGEVALVGGSGEFFCNHSNRLKERSRYVKTVFFGYCNGHHMYFPTIEAAAEGGYGGDPTVSWVSIGAGEEMMNRALINIDTWLGKYDFKMPGS